MIIQMPSPILKQKAKKAGFCDQKTITRLKQTLRKLSEPEGVGLAAPQIGSSLQIFCIMPDKEGQIEVFINPKVKVKGQKIASKSLEGCLSVDELWAYVDRHEEVTVHYLDESWVTKEKTFKGDEAFIIQHEWDHLRGVLFFERAVKQGKRIYTTEMLATAL